jgi:hypothetical protein
MNATRIGEIFLTSGKLHVLEWLGAGPLGSGALVVMR